MKHTNQTTGILFITGAAALLIPYSILTNSFGYPGILRADTETILTAFYKGGHTLVYTWFTFAITGLPLIPAYILLGQQLEQKSRMIRTATVIGVTGLILQLIGLLRWTFVVPVLAAHFVQAADEPTRAATIIAFKTIHQFAGVILGEHLGQLFTIIWTILISISFSRLKALPNWLNIFGIISALIYLLAQAELFAIVIKDFPVWEWAGFTGSTLWLLWLMMVGIVLIIRKRNNTSNNSDRFKV